MFDRNDESDYGTTPSEPAPAPFDEPRTQPGADWQTAVRGAVDAFVASTAESAKQLSAAAEAFAGETARLMEDAAAKIEAALGQNAAFAESAERAAEAARTAAATAAETALAEATARFQTEAQRYLDEMRASADAAAMRDKDLASMIEQAVEEARGAVDAQIQTSVQSLSDRLAAESRSRLIEAGASARETEDRLSQLVQTAEQSVSQAMAAASAAEAAAAKAAADFEAKTASIVEEIAARAVAEPPPAETTPATPSIDFDALSRKIEDAIDRASDLAKSAETAAAAARAAAEEARYNAEQSQSARNESWMPEAAGPVLDRLEADYSLLTGVVRELNDRISSLSLIGSPGVTPASEPVVEMPTSFPAAGLTEEPPIGEAPPAEESWEDDAPPANEPIYLYGSAPAPELTAEVTSEPEAPTPAAEESVGEEEPSSPWSLPQWSNAEPSVPQWGQVETPAESVEPETTPVAEESEPAPVVHLWTPAIEEIAASEEAAPIEAAMSDEPVSASWEPSIEETTVAETPVAEEEETVSTSYAWGTPPAISEVVAEGTLVTETPPAEETPAVEEPVTAGAVSDRIEGRVTLNVSPITDFDRLLSLDGALGRLSVITNVTLADYARDEVTFRIELGQPVSVADFARELSETAGQPIEPVEVSEGHVRLHFTGMAA
jgi:hypothetical protein